MVESPKLTIGYWKIRGLISPVKYILEFLGVPYTSVDYEQGDGPEFSRDSWLKVKPTMDLDFPNLPYLFDGDVKITESSAMLRYIANKYGKEGFSGKNPKDKAAVDMIFGVVSDIKSAFGPHMYGTGDKNAIIEISKRMELVSKFLTGKSFVAGDYITWVDFFVFEQIEAFTWITEGEFLTRYPVLAEYHKRIAALPKFAEYYKSDKFVSRPFNNKIAKLNN